MVTVAHYVESYSMFTQEDLLVVFRRQVNSVLVSRGGQVSLQTLDLLCVFLNGQKQVIFPEQSERRRLN